MQVVKDTEHKDTRAERREKEQATDTLQHLMREYIAYKNRHFSEVNGVISISPVVDECFEELNQKWRNFCYSKNSRRKFIFDVKAFSREVTKHLDQHRELCWINFVLRYCKQNLGCFPTIQNIREKYKTCTNVFTAALEIRQETFNFIMNILKIPATGFEKKFASNISELTHTEYVQYIDLVLQLKINMINIDEFKVKLIIMLLNVSSGKHYDKLLHLASKSDQAMGVVQYINSNIDLLTGHLDGFFEKKLNEKGIEELTPVLEFTKNMQPFITVPFLKFFKRKLYGPMDAMGNCTFFEFRRCHDFFIEYVDSQDEMTLAKMIAVIYRPKKLFLSIRKHLRFYDGDVRRSITAKTNESYLLKRAEKINKLHPMYKFGVFQFFKNIEEFIRFGTITIGNNQIDLNVLFENNPDYVSTGPDIGLTGILFNIAEAGTLGPVDQVDNSNMYDIIALMYKSVKESNDLKATQKKMYSNVES